MRIPNSTYRIQFNSSFGFGDALKIVEYLKELGISDIYASPIFKAAKGSMHGYDVVDPLQLNPELGTAEDFNRLVEKYKKYSMGWLQDIVPNHMAYSSENRMIIDLFENGENSRFFNFFDIEWNHPHASVRQRVLAPFLGKFFQEVLEGEELKLKYDEEGFSVNYYDNRFPLKMESYSDILSFRLSALRNKLGKNHPDMIKYLAVLYILRSLPTREELDERYSQIKFIKTMIWELFNDNAEIKEFLNETITIYNGRKDNPGSFNLLEKLLSEQNFRLAYWKVANEEINYRRFFNISSLISLKMENEEVFNRIHDYVFALIKEERIDSIRIDHVDGLYDPTGYLRRLCDRISDHFIVVEKILEMEEELPSVWTIEGTTGYEFTNHVNELFCNARNETKFSLLYQKFTRLTDSFDRLVAQKKRLIIQTRMAGEVERLAFIIEAVSSKDRYGIDITMHGLKRALEEIITYFPVYRTYINDETVSNRDRHYIEMVLKKVKRENPRLMNEYNYICRLLMLEYDDRFSEDQKKNALDFVMKFQQLTGPLMAKGFEDTALYIYNRLISLNEVGGNPGRFGISKEKFHNFNLKRARTIKHTLNTTATHDTKRGEDVRARINVLSEIPDSWESKIKTWNKLNQKFTTEVAGERAPDKNDEYFLYQTLIGSFPFNADELPDFVNRIKEYIVKAVREAKLHTAWIKPDDQYEEAFKDFIEKILETNEQNPFLDDFIPFKDQVVYYGMFNSLSQTLLKITSPGLPDFYQGGELWDLSLVDPDNRRPVDFAVREKYLNEIKQSENRGGQFIKEILTNFSDGRVKMFLIYHALKARNRFIEVFNEGEYIALNVNGPYKNNIVAFARRTNQHFIIVVVTRFLTGIFPLGEFFEYTDVWKDTRIELKGQTRQYENLLTDEIIQGADSLAVGQILKTFPVALLYASVA